MTDEPTAEVPAPRVRGSAATQAHRTGPPASGSADAPATAPGTGEGRPGPVPAGTPAAGPADTPTATPAGTPTTTPGATPADTPAALPGDGQAPPRRARRWPLVVLTLALLAALGAAGYLYATTTAYAERLAWTEDRAREIGTELVTTRGELEGVRGELEAVRTQLATAQERITALADEKAQIGDDREAQAQLLDYQARVSEAAGTVASALDRCVQGQDQLIEYLGDAASYDPEELAQFTQDVERLCRSASEANLALQSELADR